MNIFQRSAVLAATLFMAACASTGSSVSKLPPEQQVAERAEQRWQALIDKDWAVAHSLLTRGYREVHTLEAYQASFAGSQVAWDSVEVSTVECSSEERCVATVSVGVRGQGGVPGVPNLQQKQQISEVWLDTGDGWHHLPRR
jgi:hypothetical protein